MKHRLAILFVAAAIGCMAPTQQVEPPTNQIEPPTNQIEPPTNQIEPPTNQIEPKAQPQAAALGKAPPVTAVVEPMTVPSPAPRIKEALTRSLTYLERDGSAWMHGESPYNTDNGCISCHVVAFALWSHNAAAKNGLSVDRTGIERLTAEALEFIARPRIGRPVTWSQFLLGRPTSTEGAQPDWRAMVDGTLTHQENDGHWRARGQFPTQRRPVAESDAVATMWSLLALDSIAQIEESDAGAGEKALAWLAESDDGVGTEWLAMLLLTTSVYGDRDTADGVLTQLLAEQRLDGGWSWLLDASPGGEADPSNAYSTGVAIYALRLAGLPRSHPATRAAVDYLLSTQLDDGTWETASRLISAEPSEAKDYIYEYWGTAWAVIGLAEVLETATEPGVV